MRMDRIFHAYKIRYEMLNRDFLPMRASRKINRVNIFINLDDFFHKLHKPYTDQEFQTTGQEASKQMVSNILNLVGHYKNWAVKEHLNPVIFLIYTNGKIFKNAMRIQEYRSYYNKIFESGNYEFFHVNSTITSCFNTLQVIIKYVPGVFVINSHYLEPSMVPLFLSSYYPSDFNLIVSRDDYDFQYIAFNNWAIIAPLGDYSKFIVKGNMWNVLKKQDNPVHLHPAMFPWCKAVVGDKYRSIPKLTRSGWKTILKKLREVEALDETSEILDVQLHRFREYVESRKIDNTDFNNNLYCTSVKDQLNAMLDSDKAIILRQLEDYHDSQALFQMNNTIFHEFPINLQFLLREAPSVNYRPHDDYEWRKKIQ